MNDTLGNIYPIFSYRDASAAIEWLVKAFGFTEENAYRDDDGTVVHAELRYGNGVIMLSQTDKPSQGEPAANDYSIYVAVADADAHHDRAVAAGARVIVPLTNQDYGSRDYTARDLEGKVWNFGTYGA